MFSVSLVDVNAEAYDSSVSDLETFELMTLKANDRHSFQKMNYLFGQLFH